MDIKDKMREVNHFYESRRQAGHTRAAMKGAEATDGIVLAVDPIQRSRLMGDARIYYRGVSVKCLEELSSASHRPLLLDNYTLHSYFKEAINRIEELEAELEKSKS